MPTSLTPHTSPHIVIVGGGYAGLLAALRLAARTRALRPRPTITLVNATPHFVERIRLHQVAAGQTQPIHSLAQALSGSGVRLLMGRVTALDPNLRQLTLQTDPGTQTLTYDHLMLAVGSKTDTDRIPGMAQHAVTFDAPLAWADRLRRVGETGGQILVIGGGATGIEAAVEIAETYPRARVHLLTHTPFGADLSPQGAQYIRGVFARHGITLHDEVLVRQIDDGALHLADGRTLPFELCIAAAGFVAAPLMRQAGLAVNGRGQALIDGFLRSVSHPDIYVIGDAAAFDTQVGVSLRMACATAMPMGYRAAEILADTLAGRAAHPFNFGYTARCISLGRHDALLQFVTTDDQPTERIVTGQLAALTKEAICRFTVAAPAWERRLPGFYSVTIGRGMRAQPLPQPTPTAQGLPT